MPWRPFSTFNAVRIGHEIEAKDFKGHWWSAVVKQVATDATDGTKQVLVQWLEPHGYTSMKHAAWIDEPKSLRKSRPQEETLLERELAVQKSTAGAFVHDGEVYFTVKEIVGKRRTKAGKLEWRVQWAEHEGHEHEFSWEPTAMISDSQLIDDFEEKERAAAEAAAAAELDQPYTVAKVGDADTEQLGRMAEFMEEELGRAASFFVTRAQDNSTKPRVIFSAPISEELFVGLHTRLQAMPAALKLEGEATKHVTKVVAKAGARGGAKIIDQFKISSSEVIHELLTPFDEESCRGAAKSKLGALSMRNGTLPVALLGPLTVKFITTRQAIARGVRKPKRRVLVLGHVGTLQSQPSIVWKLPRFGCTEEVQAVKHKAWRHAHKIAMATSIRRLAAVKKHSVPKPLMNWLATPASELLE